MSDVIRWIIAVGVAVLVVLLVALARGDEHHRGDEVGSLGPVVDRWVADTPPGTLPARHGGDSHG